MQYLCLVVSCERQEAALTLRVIKALTGNSCVLTGNATEMSDCLYKLVYLGLRHTASSLKRDVTTRAYSKISRYGLIFVIWFGSYLLNFIEPTTSFKPNSQHTQEFPYWP